MPFKAKLLLQGSTQKDRTTLSFDLDPLVTTLPLAETAIGNIATALAAATKATIKKQWLTYVVDEDDTIPADQSADCFEEAAISVWLNPEGQAEKLHTLRLPAAIDAVYLSDFMTVDVTNQAVVDFVTAIAQNAEVSDEEEVDITHTTVAKHGRKRVKARTF